MRRILPLVLLVCAQLVYADDKTIVVDAAQWDQLRAALSVTDTPATEQEALAWMTQRVQEAMTLRIRGMEQEIAQRVQDALRGPRRQAILNAAGIPRQSSP